MYNKALVQELFKNFAIEPEKVEYSYEYKNQRL